MVLSLDPCERFDMIICNIKCVTRCKMLLQPLYFYLLQLIEDIDIAIADNLTWTNKLDRSIESKRELERTRVSTKRGREEI